MLVQLFSRIDVRTVSDVLEMYQAMGYRAQTGCWRGVYYLKLWQEKPGEGVGVVPRIQARPQNG